MAKKDRKSKKESEEIADSENKEVQRDKKKSKRKKDKNEFDRQSEDKKKSVADDEIEQEIINLNNNKDKDENKVENAKEIKESKEKKKKGKINSEDKSEFQSEKLKPKAEDSSNFSKFEKDSQENKVKQDKMTPKIEEKSKNEDKIENKNKEIEKLNEDSKVAIQEYNSKRKPTKEEFILKMKEKATSPSVSDKIVSDAELKTRNSVFEKIKNGTLDYSQDDNKNIEVVIKKWQNEIINEDCKKIKRSLNSSNGGVYNINDDIYGTEMYQRRNLQNSIYENSDSASSLSGVFRSKTRSVSQQGTPLVSQSVQLDNSSYDIRKSIK